MEYRLNRYISSSGYCSRREADEYIEAGQVMVDGRKGRLGDRVFPGQKVTVHGLLIEHDTDPVYIAFNKPVGIECTTDTSVQGNMISFINHESRIFPVGRLDKDSEGLILLTNDGEIVNKILREENRNAKEYIVTVDRPITDKFLQDMANGVPVLDRVTRKCKVEQVNPITFKITLTQGLNRQIRRMCEYLDYVVIDLQRVKVMNIELGKLGVGNWRNLTVVELEEMFNILDGAVKTDSDEPKKRSPSSQRHLEKRQQERKERFTNQRSKHKPVKDDEDESVSKEERRPRKKVAKESEDRPKAKRKKGEPAPSGLRIGKQRASKVTERSQAAVKKAKNKAKKNK